MKPKLSLRFRLGLLVAGTALPLIGFAAAVVYRHHIEKREEAFHQVLQLVRSTRLILDSETQRIVAGLQVLALSPALQTGDFEAFRGNADAYLTQYPKGQAIVVSDAAGHIVFSSAIPAGQPLPDRGSRPNHGESFRTGRPSFSPLFIGALRKQPIITVTVPVFHGTQVIYDLSINPPLDDFQRIVERQRPGPDWTFSLFDQKGVNFARLPNPERTLGQPASPTLLAELFKQDEATLRTISLEGVPLLTAYSRSDLSGWTPAAGIAEETLTAPLVQSLIITTAVGLALLALGLAFALRLATQLARAEAMRSLLVAELNHRIKNVLTIVQSLAAQTFRTTQNFAEAGRKFNERLFALSRVNTLLTEAQWQSAAMRDIVTSALEPFEASERQRVHMDGPRVYLTAQCAMMMSMLLHELATNAVKYGALSGDAGSVSIVWTREEDKSGASVRVVWQEQGGPKVQDSERRGFGTTLIQKGLSNQLGGEATLEFMPDGVRCVLRAPAI